MTFGFSLPILINVIQILESVNVWVFFKGNLIQPYSFFWHGRQIKIDKINLIQEEIREKKDKLNKIVSKKSEFKVTIRNSEELINQIKNLDKLKSPKKDN